MTAGDIAGAVVVTLMFLVLAALPVALILTARARDRRQARQVDEELQQILANHRNGMR